IFGALQLSLLPSIISIMFTDLFDSISTLMGVSHAAGLIGEDGEPKNLQEGLVVDSFATLGAGLFGSSPGTAYIESVAGIELGGFISHVRMCAVAGRAKEVGAVMWVLGSIAVGLVLLEHWRP